MNALYAKRKNLNVLFFSPLLSHNPKNSIPTIDSMMAFALYYPTSLLGACSSGVERQIVDLVVVGSTPTRHPIKA